MSKKTSAKAGQPDALPTFEEALEQVEAIIERIESGEVGLERSIAEYERGVALVRRCREVLDRAEQRVQDLTAQMLADTGTRNAAADAEPASDHEPEPPF